MNRLATSPRHAASLLLAIAGLAAGTPAVADDPACRTSAECRGGRVCRGQRCVAPQCVRDDDCGAGRYCDAAGACQGGKPVIAPAPAASPPARSPSPPPPAPPPPAPPPPSLPPAGPPASTGPDEVVLVDGSRVRGTISVEDPKSGITVVLSDGSVRQIKSADVKRTVYGGGLGAAATPALAPTATPALAPAVTPLPPDGSAAPALGPSRSWKALWVPSLITLSTVYVITIVTTVALNVAVYERPSSPANGYAVIPIFGPWINLGAYGDQVSDGVKGLLAVSGILQIAGATGLIVGLAMSSPSGSARATPPRWAVLPTFGPRQAGLTFTWSGF